MQAAVSQVRLCPRLSETACFALFSEALASADVRLVAAGGAVLYAHSRILRQRWPWFRERRSSPSRAPLAADAPLDAGLDATMDSLDGGLDLAAPERRDAVETVLVPGLSREELEIVLGYCYEDRLPEADRLHYFPLLGALDRKAYDLPRLRLLVQRRLR